MVEQFNLLIQKKSEFDARGQLVFAFKRVANCAKRASAAVRRRLDQTINACLQPELIDSEVIDAILDSVVHKPWRTLSQVAFMLKEIASRNNPREGFVGGIWSREMADKKVFLTELTNLCRRHAFRLGEAKVFEMKPADYWLAYTVNAESILILDQGDYESEVSAPSLAPTETPKPLLRRKSFAD
jgi:hypothetical protein